MTAPSLLLIADLGDKADLFARAALGLRDAEVMAEVTGGTCINYDGPFVESTACALAIVSGRSEAERAGMPIIGASTHPTVGTQWRQRGRFFTFAPSVSWLLGASVDTRGAVRRVLIPELVLGCPTLRTWHFDLRSVPVLHDLGGALCPYHPATGMALALVAADMHRSRAASLASPLSQVVRRSLAAPLPDAPAPGWDMPLAEVARTLSRDGGLPDLCARWGVTRKAVEAVAAERCPAYSAPDSSRATLMRYMIAGLA